MINFKQTIKNIIFSVFGVGIPLIVTFFTTPLLVKYLGENGYGMQVLAGIIGGYLAFLNMGLDIPLVKLLSEDDGKKDYFSANKLLNTTLVLFIAIGLIGAIGVFSLAGLLVSIFKIPQDLHSNMEIVFKLAGLSFFFNTVGGWGTGCLGGMQRYDILNIIRVAKLILIGVVGVSVVILGYGVIGLVFVRMIIGFFSAIAYLSCTFKFIDFYKFELIIDKYTLQRTKKYILNGIVLRISGFITGGLDNTLIGIFIGLPFVAAYGILKSVLTPLGGMLDSFSGFFFPMASSLHATNNVEYLKKSFLALNRINIFIASLAYILLFFYGKAFISLWVGGEIVEKIHTLFPLLVISTYLSRIFVAVTNEIVVGSGNIGLFTCYSIIKSVFFAALLYLGIFYFGLNGVGFAFLALSSCIDLPYMYISTKKVLSLSNKELLETYIRQLLPLIFIVIIGCPLVPSINSWFMLICSVLISAIIITTLLYFFYPSKYPEKQLLKKISIKFL